MFLEGSSFNGKRAAKQLRLVLRGKVELLSVKYGITPGLAIIMVGNNPSSLIYIHNKLRFAEEVGFNTKLYHYASHEVTTADIQNKIRELNQQPDISSIIVQLPLPEHLDAEAIINTIDEIKDVDGLTIHSIGRLANRQNQNIFVVPCTAEACLYILHDIFPEPHELTGKKILLIGDSDIVGRPLLQLLMREQTTVTIANRNTKDLDWECLHNEIIVSATGHPHLITADMVREDQVILDVGITRETDPLTKETVIVGDVDYKNVVHKVKAITPVPGGVGPLTVAFVLHNTFNLCLQQHNLSF